MLTTISGNNAITQKPKRRTLRDANGGKLGESMCCIGLFWLGRMKSDKII